MTDQIPPTPAGWYHAPGDPDATQRYWDGELWQGDPVPVAQSSSAAAMNGNPSYAGWGTRVGAKLVDALIATAAFLAVFIVSRLVGVVSDTLGSIVGILLGVAVLAGVLYLFLWLPGITGQSPGRRIMGYEIVSEQSGSYVGGAAFLGREIIGTLINNLCYIDYLWPLWDPKNQRLADKIISSIAVQKPAGKLLPIFPSGKPF